MIEHQNSNLRRKRDQFVISLRKQRNNQYFKQRRGLLIQKMVQQQRQMMKQKLNSPQLKQQFIRNKALGLTGLPNNCWRTHIQQLSASVMAFQSDFGLWIQSGIIKNLCQLFKDDYLQLNLNSHAAKLLSMVIYCEQQKYQEKTSMVVQQILKHEILQNLCSITRSPNNSQQQKASYLMLLTNISLTDRHMVQKAGGLSMAIQWGYQILKQSKINVVVLETFYEFLNCMVYNRFKTPISYNTAFSVFTVLTQFILIQQTLSLKRRILYIFQNIVSHNQRPVIKAILQNNKVCKFIFEHSTNQKQSIRKISWRIISYLTSTKIKFAQIFQQNHYFQALKYAFSMQIQQQDNFDHIADYMLISLGNIADQGQIYRQRIIKQRIIDMILDFVHPNRSLYIRRSGYHALENVCYTNSLQLYNKLIFEYPVIEKLAMALESMDIQTIYQVLGLFIHLIQFQNRIYRQQGNIIFNLLQSKFNFQKILDYLEITFTKNNLICERIDRIRDLQGIVI